MKQISVFFRLIDKFYPPVKVHAHCDVPCGLYDTAAAKMAANTVVKMVEKINALPGDEKDPQKMLEARNSFVRMVITKEQHAEICKRELLILWTDFFKSEHLEMFPQLHETFWHAAKLCSKNKQNISTEAAEELQEAVVKIEEMFQAVKAKSVK